MVEISDTPTSEYPVDRERVRAALAGEIDPATLTADEEEAFYEAYAHAFDQSSAAALEFFATSPKLRGAVGLDENGNLVRELGDGCFGPLERIDDDEIAARQAALRSAQSSSRIENLYEHPDDAAIVDRYALGELTIEQAIAAVIARKPDRDLRPRTPSGTGENFPSSDALVALIRDLRHSAADIAVRLESRS